MAGVESTQSIPGVEWISGRKRTEAGTTDDKSFCLPVARVVCVHLNMGVCDFQRVHFHPNNNAWFQGSWAAACFSHLNPYSV